MRCEPDLNLRCVYMPPALRKMRPIRRLSWGVLCNVRAVNYASRTLKCTRQRALCRVRPTRDALCSVLYEACAVQSWPDSSYSLCVMQSVFQSVRCVQLGRCAVSYAECFTQRAPCIVSPNLSCASGVMQRVLCRGRCVEWLVRVSLWRVLSAA